MPDNPLTPVGQALLGILCDEARRLRLERGGQHLAGADFTLELTGPPFSNRLAVPPSFASMWLRSP
jgi:hypothetical protein